MSGGNIHRQFELAVFLLVVSVHVCTPTTTTYRTPATTPARHAWLMYDFPNPLSQPGKCGRGNEQSWICDPDGVISRKDADYIDRELSKTCEETNCVCEGGCGSLCDGYSLSIGIVKKMVNTSAGSDPGKQVHMWAEFLRKTRWDFGACDNNLVIVLSRDDGKFRTATGPTMRDRLSDSCVDAIMDSSLKNFTEHNFTAGLADLVTKYRYVLKGGDCIWIHQPGKMESGTMVGIIVAGLLLILLLVLICCCSKRLRKNKKDKKKKSVRGESVELTDEEAGTASYKDTPDDKNNDDDKPFVSPDGGGGAGGSF